MNPSVIGAAPNLTRFIVDVHNSSNSSYQRTKVILSVENQPLKDINNNQKRSEVFAPVVKFSLPENEIVENIDIGLWKLGFSFKTMVMIIKTNNHIYYEELQPILVNNARVDNSIKKYEAIVLPKFRGLDPNFVFRFSDTVHR
jgi:hypothetical protein